MSEWLEVSERELRRYVNTYPEKLITDTCFIVEPPQFTFNVVRDGVAHPVARYYDDYLDNNKRHCFILVEIMTEDEQRR